MKARVVVVAAGPWTDEVLRLCRHPGAALRPTKGVHLVFGRNRLNVQQVVVVPTEDKRMIFVVPFGEFTYVGTTDTDYAGSLDRVLVEAADVSYLLDAVNHCFPTLKLGPQDVVSCWAGLRPLVQGEGAPSQVSRDYDISLYDDGLVVITGGKLTTHRTMAMSLVDQVLERYAHRLEGEFKPCRTGETALVGGEIAEFSSYLKAQSLGLVRKWGLSETTVDHLILSYGRHHMDILALGLRDRKLLEPIAPGCRVIKAEVIHAVEEEMALTLEDFMSRRTSLLHFDCEHGAPVTVAKLMGKWLGWNRSRRRAEIRRYREAVKEMFHFRSASYGE